MKRRTFLATASAAAAFAASPLLAQGRTARIVVGFAAGGPGDLLARVAADHMKPRWAPAVVVDNKPGGGGRLSIETTKTADPDGLTLLNTPASILTIQPHAYKTMPFDPFADLVPVAALAELDFAIVAGPMAPVKTLAEYVDLARKDPKLATYGTAGAGTPQHLIGFKLGQVAGVTFTHAAYRGGAPALQDTMAGQIPMTVGAVSGAMIQAHNEGKARILATTGTRRSAFLPDIPTAEEAGFKGVVATDWSGLYAPPKTPAAALEQAGQAVAEMVKDPAYRDAVAKLNMVPMVLDAKGCAARLRQEFDYWGPAVKATGFTLEG